MIGCQWWYGTGVGYRDEIMIVLDGPGQCSCPLVGSNVVHEDQKHWKVGRHVAREQLAGNVVWKVSQVDNGSCKEEQHDN
jgi:hypothetical protein